jgi:hypothetical protein
MLRVLIEPGSTPETKTGNKNGKDWSIVQQRVRVFQPGSQYPDSFMFVLPQGVAGYPSGEYIWDVSSQIERGSFDSVAFARGQRLVSATPENLRHYLERTRASFEIQLSALGLSLETVEVQTFAPPQTFAPSETSPPSPPIEEKDTAAKYGLQTKKAA